MKVGLFGGRGDDRGLAHQTLSYVKHLDFTRVYCIDMTADDLSPYPVNFKPFTDHCDEVTIVRHSQIEEQSVRKWLRGLDIVFAVETFYRDDLPTWAREEGVRTVHYVNPEFAAWGQPKDRTPLPDVMIVSTPWRLDHLPPQAIVLPMPVDRLAFPFRVRTQANRFVHVAGHKAAADRAGSRIVLAATRRTKHDMVIRSQSPFAYSSASNVEVGNCSTPQELYADADVIIHPRRYGGNSLVIQEALSSGCPVITLDREPENTWSGTIPIPSRVRQQLRTKAGPVPIYDGAPQLLARVMDDLHADPARVEALSYAANEHARSISWHVMLPVYNDFFKAVVNGTSDDVLRELAAFRRPPHTYPPVTP